MAAQASSTIAEQDDQQAILARIPQLLDQLERSWLAGDEKSHDVLLSGIGPETGGFEQIMLGNFRKPVRRLLRQLDAAMEESLASVDPSLRDEIVDFMQNSDLRSYCIDVFGGQSDLWRQPWGATLLSKRAHSLKLKLAAELRRQGRSGATRRAKNDPVPTSTTNESLTEPQKRVLRFIEENPTCHAKQIKTACGWTSDRHVFSVTGVLKERGLITHERGKGYRIVET